MRAACACQPNRRGGHAHGHGGCATAAFAEQDVRELAPCPSGESVCPGRAGGRWLASPGPSVGPRGGSVSRGRAVKPGAAHLSWHVLPPRRGAACTAVVLVRALARGSGGAAAFDAHSPQAGWRRGVTAERVALCRLSPVAVRE